MEIQGSWCRQRDKSQELAVNSSTVFPVEKGRSCERQNKKEIRNYMSCFPFASYENAYFFFPLSFSPCPEWV